MKTKTAKHTPGPWMIKDQGDDAQLLIVSNDGSIAAVTHRGMEASGQDWDANARLIAAAPDLLEAAKLALGLAASLEDDEADVPGMGTALAKKLRAAIAKAEGREAAK